MTKRTTSILVAVLVIMLLTSGLLVGCQRGVVIGSGKLDTREFDFTGFTRVEVGHAFEVEIVQSDSYRVSITADDNLFVDHIMVSKAGETLKIGLKPALSYNFTTLKAQITMPDLYGLDLSGAVHGTVEGFSSTHDFTLQLSGASSLDMADMVTGDIKCDSSGASKVTGDITADDAEFNESGASNVQLQGSASNIVIHASGASRVNLADLPVNNANVELSGASLATVNAGGRLDINLSGASKLSYIGEPTMGSINISGGSTLSKE